MVILGCLLVTIVLELCATASAFVAGETKHRNTAFPQLCSDIKAMHGRQNGIIQIIDEMTVLIIMSGAFITRDPGQWSYRADGSMEYNLKTCKLHRYSVEEARQCLAGHHIFMIGDSLTRYQYIDLIYFLEHGVYPPRFGVDKDGCKHFDADGEPTCSPANSPSPVMETDWGGVWGHSPDKSWKQFHMWLGGRGFNHRLECQCVRNQLTSSAENMFYEYTPEAGPGAAANGTSNRIEATFFLNLGNNNISGWKRSFCSRSGTCNMTDEWWATARAKGEKGHFDFVWDFENATEAVLEAMGGMAPGVDIALYNRGVWGELPANYEHTQRVMRGLHRMTKANARHGNGGKCFWKGTSALSYSHLLPARRRGKATSLWKKEQRLRTTAYGAGCGVYDLAHVTQEFMKFEWNGDIGRNECCGEKEGRSVFWDAVHFQPWVYEELNNILLNVLC